MTPLGEILAGRRIVNTRATHQAAALDALLIERGAIPVSYPCIGIVPPDDTRELDAALQAFALQAGDFDLLVLTSANTVTALRERLDVLGLSLRGMQAAAVGAATAQAARDALGVEVVVMPKTANAAALARALPDVTGRRVLLPQSAGADPLLRDSLRERGADVQAVTAYRTIKGRGGAAVAALLRGGMIDAALLTSASTARYFVERLRDEGIAPSDLPTMVCIACIGDVTVQGALDAGLHVSVVAGEASLAGLVAAVGAYFEHRNLPLRAS